MVAAARYLKRPGPLLSLIKESMHKKSPLLIPAPSRQSVLSFGQRGTEKSGSILLTTDDELVRIMMKNPLCTSICVDNPLHWLMEVNHNGD